MNNLQSFDHNFFQHDFMYTAVLALSDHAWITYSSARRETMDYIQQCSHVQSDHAWITYSSAHRATMHGLITYSSAHTATMHAWITYSRSDHACMDTYIQQCS